ncbi:TolC family protein [Methylomonas koyamae]|nr:TolC family protein [Methylomonas koyamae]
MHDADLLTTESAANIPPIKTTDEGLPSEAHTYTLDAAIKQALDADPQIRAGVETVRQAEADLVTAGLPPNPSLSTSGSLMPLNKPFTVDRQGGPPQLDVGVSFPVDWFLFGKRAAAVIAAEKGVDVATAGFSDLVRQRIAGTISAFYDVLEAQSSLELAREDLQNLSEVEKITANRVELGGVGTVELDRVRLSIFSSRREARAREVALEGSLSRLRSFLGYTQSIALKINGSLDVSSPAAPLAPETVFAVAEENRPDIIALKNQVTQAEATVELEERNAYPVVTPKIGYTRQFQEKAIGYPDANSWGIGVDMTVPLFDRNQGNINKAKSAKVQTEYTLNAQLVALRAEIDQALKAYESAYQVLTTDDPGQLEAARNVRDKIRTAYELGGKTLMEVLDAQRTYRETYRLYIAGRSNYWHSLHALNAAIGKQVVR